jgi:hypothetical protein
MNKDLIGALIFATVITILALWACFNHYDDHGNEH